jgi:hypothetical protein
MTTASPSGHGLVANPKTTDDIRNHPFYGNHNAVARNLDALQKACLDFCIALLDHRITRREYDSLRQPTGVRVGRAGRQGGRLEGARAVSADIVSRDQYRAFVVSKYGLEKG